VSCEAQRHESGGVCCWGHSELKTIVAIRELNHDKPNLPQRQMALKLPVLNNPLDDSSLLYGQVLANARVKATVITHTIW
jgi:hypothetical protein